MSGDPEVKWHRFTGLAVIDSAFDLTRPGKANEGDGLASASFASPQEATHDFFDPTASGLCWLASYTEFCRAELSLCNTEPRQGSQP
jgi:hypothetical protein